MSDHRLREARDCFADMLRAETKERDWQSFFSEHPYVLSESLPLKIAPEDICPLGRPGRSEADFVFYPKTPQLPYVYGVIELKRPSSAILAVPRKTIVTLSRDAEAAVAQARQYSKQLAAKCVDRRYRMLSIGDELHAFVIMGLAAEIAQKITNDILSDGFARLLPPGFRLIPYDTLYSMFESHVPRQVHMLMPVVVEPPLKYEVDEDEKPRRPRETQDEFASGGLYAKGSERYRRYGIGSLDRHFSRTEALALLDRILIR